MLYFDYIASTSIHTAHMTPATPVSPSGLEHFVSTEFASTGLPFSEMVRVGDMLYLSGQMGTLPGTLALVEGGMAAEARQALQNIERVLQAHGYSLGHVVKCTVMLADMADWPAFNNVYCDFFKTPYPARSAFGANGLALGSRLEIDVIATTGQAA